MAASWPSSSDPVTYSRVVYIESKPELIKGTDSIVLSLPFDLIARSVTVDWLAVRNCCPSTDSVVYVTLEGAFRSFRNQQQSEIVCCFLPPQDSQRLSRVKSVYSPPVELIRPRQKSLILRLTTGDGEVLKLTDKTFQLCCALRFLY